jgi:hypothetical protein
MIESITLSGKIELLIEKTDKQIKIKYQQHVLYNDYLKEGLTVFSRMLQKAIAGELELTGTMKLKGIGYWWNEFTNRLEDEKEQDEEDKAEKYWLWSTRYLQTWLYTYQNKVCIEISPSYPFHFVDPTEDEEFIAYREFIAKYNIISVLQLNYEDVEEVLRKIEQILSN